MKRLIKHLIKLVNKGQNSIIPLITVSLSKTALIHNLNEFRTLAGNNTIAPVLKSNAYGHGIYLIGHELEKKNIPFLIIDSYFEANALRNDGIKTPLLIIGYVRPENINDSKLKNIVYVISSIDSLKLIKSKVNIHLKIDTGMNRQGISITEKIEAIEIIKNNKNIILEGICSHFSDADNSDSTYTKKQIAEWNNLVEYFKQEFPTLKYWHISASAGHIYKEAKANMTRLGIGLYGLINISGLNLKPILEMKTIITGIKKIKTGDYVGYGCTFKALQDMTIATISLGYFEGIDRRLSNKGFIKINNQFFPIVGRVSMNITIIDISNIENIKVGDEVIVMSNIKEDKNSIENIAKDCDTISYEIVVKIPEQLKRIVVN